VTLSAKKPLPEPYPKTLRTIGDHIRKRRLDLKLFQKDVACILGVDTTSVCNWENNRGPAINMIPKIIQFLEYNPFNNKFNTLGEKIKWYRKQRGMSQKQLAKRLDVDPTTLARWERSESEPNGMLKEQVNLFLLHLI